MFLLFCYVRCSHGSSHGDVLDGLSFCPAPTPSGEGCLIVEWKGVIKKHPIETLLNYAICPRSAYFLPRDVLFLSLCVKESHRHCWLDIGVEVSAFISDHFGEGDAESSRTLSHRQTPFRGLSLQNPNSLDPVPNMVSDLICTSSANSRCSAWDESGCVSSADAP